MLKSIKPFVYLFLAMMLLSFKASGEALSTDSKNIYTPQSLDRKENMLNTVASHIDNYTFTLLKAGNTTPNAWIVKDKQQNNVGMIKCTSGNNYANAEIAAYYLGRKLNFPIFPVTVPVKISSSLGKKLNILPQTCALKEWITNWGLLYWKAQANLSKIIQKNQYKTYLNSNKNSFLSATGDNKKLADTLMCNNDLIDVKDTFIQLSSSIKTRNGDPLYKKNTPTLFVSDPVNLLKTAKDFSNLMVMDAVIENGDRFPGKNIEFRSSINQSKIMDNQRVMILDPRISSLDTGLAFKGWHNSWARIEMIYYLRRFDPQMIDKLKLLLKTLNHLNQKDLNSPEWRFLNFNTQLNPKISAVNYLKDNIQWTLNFVQNLQQGKYQEVIPGKNALCKQIFFN